jgi:hypothetical protein
MARRPLHAACQHQVCVFAGTCGPRCPASGRRVREPADMDNERWGDHMAIRILVRALPCMPNSLLSTTLAKLVALTNPDPCLSRWASSTTPWFPRPRSLLSVTPVGCLPRSLLSVTPVGCLPRRDRGCGHRMFLVRPRGLGTAARIRSIGITEVVRRRRIAGLGQCVRPTRSTREGVAAARVRWGRDRSRRRF